MDSNSTFQYGMFIAITLVQLNFGGHVGVNLWPWLPLLLGDTIYFPANSLFFWVLQSFYPVFHIDI